MAGQNLKSTALHKEHKALGAKMVDFGGWHMPIQFEGVLAEHAAVRGGCGVFDVSHMGEILVTGADAEKFLQYMTVNDLGRLANGQGQYTALLNSQGGMIDDLILYRLNPTTFFLCVNASNIQKDYSWLVSKAGNYKVKVENESDKWSQLAVQGPECLPLLAGIPEIKENLKNLEYMNIVETTIFNQKALIARTGYTGEQGFEIYVNHEAAVKLWRALIEKSAKPIGLGARDTLRLEACYLLYGNDMDDNVSPLEAGIGWAVRLDKEEFIGKEVLIDQKEKGTPRKMVAFLMEEKGIARQGMDVYAGNEKVGTVTSASFLPTLNQAGGMALVKSNIKIGDELAIDIRGKRKLAKVMKRPLYSARTK